jgi:hypothetical protein
MEEKIVLASTQRGFMSRYFWSLIWLVIFVGLAIWFSSQIDSIYAAEKVSSWKEFSRNYERWHYASMHPFPWLHIGMYLSWLIAGVIFVCNLCTGLYSARKVNTFYKNKEGHWSKIICESYGFPFNRKAAQAVFDRVIKINIVQASIDRLIGTGTLEIKIATFTNANADTEYWTIPAIKNPYQRKTELEAALLSHEGLKVKLSQD